MEIKKVHLVYFSPTGNTQSVIRIVARSFCNEISEYDMTSYSSGDMQLKFEEDDVVIFGFPVYGGRVPETFRARMNGVNGQDTLAAIIATYGNRDYEDALFEIKDIVENDGFLPIGAAAVATEHSVIRSIASGRPDANDNAFLEDFCSKLKKKIALITSKEEIFKLTVPGGKPYRRYVKLPMTPAVAASCTACGLCEKKCPVGAISKKNLLITDKEKCIGCMRCVRICPQNARKLPKIKMVVGQLLLSSAARVRKEPEMFF